MSVPVDGETALVTVIALLDVVLTLDIIKWLVDHVTVSVEDVAALIAACMLAATVTMLRDHVKFMPVMSYDVQSIDIVKDPSVTAAHVAATEVAELQPVKYAGVQLIDSLHDETL